jgi:N-acetylmuramoyl-L-alanine amidase
MIICGFVFMWGFSGKREVVMTVGNTSQIRPDRQVIVIDAGHGGMDGGCVSVDGTAEKYINLAIASDCRDLFRALGFEPVCTRETDEAIYDEGTEGLSAQKLSDMENRLEIFSRYADGISLSIHQNQFTDSQYSGAQMFYQEGNAGGELLAQTLRGQFAALLQPDNTRETKPVTDELYLLKNTQCPAVMVECGFLSNPDEAALLESEDYQKKVAFTVATGVCEFIVSRQ